MITYNDIYEAKRNPLFSFGNFLKTLNDDFSPHLDKVAKLRNGGFP